MKHAWRGLLAGVLAAGVFALACNAIVGVEDVRLRGRVDSGAGPGDTPDGDVTPVANTVRTALGANHSCARRVDGTVRCWGDDFEGQIGVGQPLDGGAITPPATVAGISDAVAIGAGQSHTCIVHASGGVSCWGYNFDGQLGNGETGNVHATPVDVTGLTDAVAVAGGSNFTCAVRKGGGVACWGANGSGQLGLGTTTATPTPASVSGLASVVALAAGQAHACAVRKDGSLLCWGDGTNGQLGTGSTSSASRPVRVDSIASVTAVAAGERSTCALTGSGKVYCWGANEVGQLGNGAANDLANPAPIVVANVSDAVALASGPDHTCVARAGGAVACWGDAQSGALGNPLDAGFQASAVATTGVTNAIGVGAGSRHSCAALADETVVCWGANDRGQLGNGATGSTSMPVLVGGFP